MLLLSPVIEKIEQKDVENDDIAPRSLSTEREIEKLEVLAEEPLDREASSSRIG